MAFIFIIILASLNTLRPLQIRPISGLDSELDKAEPVDQGHTEVSQAALDVPHQVTSHSVTDHTQSYRSPSPLPTTPTSTSASTSRSTSTLASPTPTSTELSKILVMGKLLKEDTDWVGNDLSDWHNAIYYVDLPSNETSPSGLRTKINKAKEATPYLTYIVDNYPKFPDVMAFVHAHKNGMPTAWHNDARNHDAVNMMRDLKLETVIERGYVNLRCITEIGCPDEVQPFRDPPNGEKHAEHAFPYVYADFFNVTWAAMQEQIPIVATPCCAQFAVSRAQILARPKEDYEKYMKYIENTHFDDDTSGRVMEYMWHIIFGRDAVHCDNQLDCWCAVFGRCWHRGGW